MPCCAEADSTGTVVSIVGGTLTLEDVPPELFGCFPGGCWPLSCNGAHSTCGNGAYALVFVQQYGGGGPVSVRSDTSLGRFGWSADSMIRLVSGGMGGFIWRKDSVPTISIQRLKLMGGYGPTYEFSRTGP